VAGFDFVLELDRGEAHSAAGAPVTRPLVGVGTLGGLRTAIHLTDETTPTRRARPPLNAGAYLWCKLDGDPPRTVTECTFLGTATRARHIVTHPASALNKTVWILAQWVNARGETGPTGNVASASVAA